MKSNSDNKSHQNNKQQKKNKKSKAVDYYDYAQKNGINYNIQYEDNQNQKKRDENKSTNVNYPKANYTNNHQNKKNQYQSHSNQTYQKNNVTYAAQAYEDPNEKLISGSNKFDENQKQVLIQNKQNLHQNQHFNNHNDFNSHEVTPTFEKISLDETNPEKSILDSL